MTRIDDKTWDATEAIVEAHYDETIRDAVDDTHLNYDHLSLLAGAASYAEMYFDYPDEILSVFEECIGTRLDDLGEDELPKALAHILEDDAESHFRADLDLCERATCDLEEYGLDDEYLRNVIAEAKGEPLEDEPSVNGVAEHEKE